MCAGGRQDGGRRSANPVPLTVSCASTLGPVTQDAREGEGDGRRVSRPCC